MCFLSDKFYLARKMMKLFLDISTLSQKKHLFTSCVFHSSVFLHRCAVKFKSHSPIISHFPCVLSQQWWRLTDTDTPWLRGPGAWDVIHWAEFDKKAIDTKLQRPVVSPACGAELGNRSYHELWDIKWEWSPHWHKLISSNTSQCSEVEMCFSSEISWATIHKVRVVILCHRT